MCQRCHHADRGSRLVETSNAGPVQVNQWTAQVKPLVGGMDQFMRKEFEQFVSGEKQEMGMVDVQRLMGQLKLDPTDGSEGGGGGGSRTMREALSGMRGASGGDTGTDTAPQKGRVSRRRTSGRGRGGAKKPDQ